MSYLNPPRLHFAGTFRTDVSTVNNYVTHFQNPNNPPQPGWNPSGSGSWSVTGCTVTSAVLADGTVARTPADDPIVGASLTQKGTARLVDLDPEQQLVSEIWGLQLQLGKTGVAPSVKGAFELTAFSDLWGGRARVAGGGDFKMSAFYQSVLTQVAWGDLLGSPCLAALQQASAAGLLSIKFNFDGFMQASRTGRIVGTIGAAQSGEPAHFVAGRQCMGDRNGPVWYFPAVVDAQRGRLIADFGNALQTTSPGGPFDPTLNLQIGMLAENGQFSPLGKLPIGPGKWYRADRGRVRVSARPRAVGRGTGAARYDADCRRAADRGRRIPRRRGGRGWSARSRGGLRLSPEHQRRGERDAPREPLRATAAEYGDRHHLR